MKNISYLLLIVAMLAHGEKGFSESRSGMDSLYIKAERIFQQDADLVRLADLAYWTGLIEDYQQKTGHYPLQNALQATDDIILVKVATRFQRQYLSAGGKHYVAAMDNNRNGRFNEKTMQQFVSVLEAGLNKSIDEKYDIQKVPTASPIGYNYFVTKDGYLFWVTCITCGVTPISTLLMDGFTPTVNIASSGMVNRVTKAQTRQAMLANPIYQKWRARPFHKGKYIQQLVNKNLHDTKQ